MRRSSVLALLLALAVAGCFQRGVPRDTTVELTRPRAASVATLPRELQIVTFNVHGQTARNVLAGLRSDRALRDADLIVLQEVHRDESTAEPCSAACGLGSELGFHALYAPGHAISKGSHGVAIVSRAPLTAPEVIELPYFNVHFNSGRRVALAATVSVDGVPVTVYAVHLDNRLTVGDRRKQMMPVIEHAKRQTTPLIIAGDFNTSPFTWIAHVIPVLTTTQDNRFEQLMRKHGFATPLADSGPTSRFLAMKLDAIYTRGFDTKAFATAHARNISDHLALWAYIQPQTGSLATGGTSAGVTHAAP